MSSVISVWSYYSTAVPRTTPCMPRPAPRAVLHVGGVFCYFKPQAVAAGLINHAPGSQPRPPVQCSTSVTSFVISNRKRWQLAPLITRRIVGVTPATPPRAVFDVGGVSCYFKLGFRNIITLILFPIINKMHWPRQHTSSTND